MTILQTREISSHRTSRALKRLDMNKCIQRTENNRVQSPADSASSLDKLRKRLGDLRSEIDAPQKSANHHKDSSTESNDSQESFASSSAQSTPRDAIFSSRYENVARNFCDYDGDDEGGENDDDDAGMWCSSQLAVLKEISRSLSRTTSQISSVTQNSDSVDSCDSKHSSNTVLRGTSKSLYAPPKKEVAAGSDGGREKSDDWTGTSEYQRYLELTSRLEQLQKEMQAVELVNA